MPYFMIYDCNANYKEKETPFSQKRNQLIEIKIVVLLTAIDSFSKKITRNSSRKGFQTLGIRCEKAITLL